MPIAAESIAPPLAVLTPTWGVGQKPPAIIGIGIDIGWLQCGYCSSAPLSCGSAQGAGIAGKDEPAVSTLPAGSVVGVGI